MNGEEIEATGEIIFELNVQSEKLLFKSNRALLLYLTVIVESQACVSLDNMTSSYGSLQSSSSNNQS
jgi:hypothetical protein